MTKRSTRIIGGALASAALAFTVLLPVASADGIGVDRNCVQVDDSQGNCIYQTSNPSAGQGVFQLGGDTKNSNEVEQKLKQEQKAAQIGGAAVVSIAGIDKIMSMPSLNVKSGEVDVQGNKQELYLFAPQIASAGPKVDGNIRMDASTGNANIGEVEGNVNAKGGDASAYQKSSNEIETEGNQKVSYDAYLNARGGSQEGNSAGNGGDIKGGGAGDGGFNLALALQGAKGGNARGGNAGNSTAIDGAVAVGVDTEDETSADNDGNANANSKGGFALGGFAVAAADQDQGASGGYVSVGGTTGAGGDANSGAAGNGGTNNFQPGAGTNNNLTGAVTQNASGAAVGGNASAGAQGHYVIGGVTGDSFNSISMSGGIATNNLTVTPTINGNVSGNSGQVCNDGSVTSNVTPNFNQGGTATNNQDQNTNQAGSNNSTTGNQTANGGGQTSTANQTVRSGEQEAEGSNHSSFSVGAPHRN